MPLRKTVAAISIVVLVALSSTRLLDDYVDTYTSNALKTAAITYATARGLNAIVSILQSSSVEAGVGVVSGSLTIGEILDPVNDMIERFSTVMTWVLASLAAQKVLLLLASHELFLYLVATLGVTALLLLFYGSTRAQNLVFRCFLVVIFVRFALGLAVGLNSGVDLLFLEPQRVESDAQIERFQRNLLDLDGDETLDPSTFRDSALKFWRSLSLDELNRRIGDGIEHFINLVAIYLLKTILFPLGFFYAAFYAIRLLWRLEFAPEPARLEPV